MMYTGKVHGAAARKYSEFCYRKALMTDLTLVSVDPDRLHPAHEYPRYCPSPSRPSQRINDLADFEVRILEGDESISYGMALVQVWMCSNRYTQARQNRQVLEFFASNAFVLRSQMYDKAMEMAFQV